VSVSVRVSDMAAAYEPHYYRDPITRVNLEERDPSALGIAVNRSAVLASDVLGDDLLKYDQLCDLFKTFDLNDNNSVESDELQQLLRHVLVVSEQLFTEKWLEDVVSVAFATHRKYDRNRDGRMDRTEFFRFMEEFVGRDCISELLEEVRPLFFLPQNFDARKLLGMAEVARLVKKLYEGLGCPCEDTEAWIVTQQGFATHDKNRDGFLHFFEFVSFMRGLRASIIEYLKNLQKEEGQIEDDEEAGRQRYLEECRAENAKGAKLECDFDFDKRGLVYWIGSKAANELWSNPALSYVTPTTKADVIVTCTLDPTAMIQGDVRSVLDRAGEMAIKPQVFRVTCPSSNAASLWVKIDMGPTREIVPTMYTLRHSNQDGGEMRNWVLEGSCFGSAESEDWVILAMHQNDRSLKGIGSTASWAITDAKMAFRFFRITATGPDADGDSSLDIAGFELYGTFLRQNPQY